MSGRFEERLDVDTLKVGHAKITSSDVTGFDDDGELTLVYRVGESLSYEAIEWLKTNQLVYTDIVTDFRNFSGVWRTEKISYDNRSRGVVQTLKKGYYTELNWDSARILFDRIRPAGTNIELYGGDEQERYLTFSFPYIDPASENSIVHSMPETKDDLPELPAGTWYLIDATSEKQDDGTYTIKALYGNISTFAISGRSSFGLPDGATTYYYTGVPKQLAQGICDLYQSEGDSVTPSFSYGNGLVDIRVEVGAVIEIAVSGVLTESTCQIAEHTTFVFGAASIPVTLPSGSQGITYRLRGVSQQRNGKYNYQIIKRTRMAAVQQEYISDINEAKTTQTITTRGACSVETPSKEQHHIKNQNVRINDDCTFDIIENDATIANQEVARHTSTDGYFDTTLRESKTSAEDVVEATGGKKGVVVTTSNEPTPQGTFRTRMETRMSKPVQTAISDKVGDTELASTDEWRYKNSINPVQLGVATIGQVLRKTERDNADGSKDVSVTTRTSKEKNSTTDIVVEKQTYTETTQSITKNAREASGILDVADGETRRKTFRVNEDSTFDTIESTEVRSEIDHGTVVVKQNEANTVTRSSLSNTSSDIIDTPLQGETTTLSRRQNEDGTFEIIKETELETSLEGRFHKIDLREEITDESWTGNTEILSEEAPTARRIMETRSTPKPNGLWQTVKRTIRSILQNNTSRTIKASAASITTREGAHNATSTPAVSQVKDHIVRLDHRINPDGTFDYDLFDETVVDQEARGGQASPLSVIETESHTQGEDLGVPSAGEGYVVTHRSTPTDAGNYRTEKSTDEARTKNVQQIKTGENAFQTTTTDRSRNITAPTGVRISSNEAGRSSFDINKYGIVDESVSKTVPKPDVGDNEYPAGGNAFETQETTVTRNASDPTIDAPTGNTVESGSHELNEFGLYNVRKTTTTPILSVETDATVTKIAGIAKMETSIHRNMQSMPVATRNGEVYSGVTINKFGLYDYIKTVTLIAEDAGYSFSYYGPTFTDDRSTYVAEDWEYKDKANKTKVALKTFMTNWNKVKMKWKYTVTVSYFMDSDSAASFVRDGYEGSGVSSVGNGIFRATRKERSMVVA